MRLRHITGSEDIIAGSEHVVHEPETMKNKWNTVFSNNASLYIEIGMGKGRFIIENALRNPEINYVGIERYSSVLLKALNKIDAMEKAPDNLKFICMDAGNIDDVFGEGEVGRIYLNFSDPWPKDRHAKRRLPSRQFLERYDHILKKEGVIEFKTDNRDLFDFALNELPIAGWKAQSVTYDLHNDEKMNEGNIMTEYEEKFSAMGNPICKYIITRGM